MKSNDLNARGLLNTPPLIKPDRMPKDIIGDDYDLIKSILLSYKKSGLGWDEYARKLEPGTQETLKKVFFECRCNGFMNPTIEGDRIHFQQMVKKTDIIDKYELTPKDMKGEYDANNYRTVI
jgi:hypothetical protein